jgi:hypothetical protein
VTRCAVLRYAEAHNNLGVLQRDVGAIPDALSSYERALQLVPDSRNAGRLASYVGVSSLGSRGNMAVGGLMGAAPHPRASDHTNAGAQSQCAAQDKMYYSSSVVPIVPPACRSLFHST